jgi:mRNA interferase MazF
MPSYSKPEVVLVRHPFSDLTSSKVRPAVVVNAAYVSQDLFVVPLTSKTGGLLAGEFVLAARKPAGLNVETAVKRGVYTIKETLVRRRVGKLNGADAEQVEKFLRGWLDLP